MWIRSICMICALIAVVAARPAGVEKPELMPRSVLDGTVVIPVPVSFELVSKEMALRVIAAGPHKPHPL